MNILHLKQAVKICEEGGVIAYPTESVFGLGCLLIYEHSVLRILSLKRRSIKKGLICVAANIEQLGDYVDLQKVPDLEMVTNSWPGPVTWLIPARFDTPYWLTGEHNTLAVRVSANPVVRTLCEHLGPIVSTSANPQERAPAYNAQRVRSYFQDKLDYVIPGILNPGQKPTEIRDAMTGKIIRIS